MTVEAPIMTREAQMKAAMKLLKPASPADRAKCVSWLALALDMVATDKDQTKYEKDVASKEARKALRIYRAALHRAKIAHQNLPVGMQKKCDELGKFPYETTLPDFAALIAACDMALKPARYPSRSRFDRFSAAVWANNVLKGLGMKAAVTRGGKWIKLAAILHGKEGADLFHDCRKASHSIKRG